MTRDMVLVIIDIILMAFIMTPPVFIETEKNRKAIKIAKFICFILMVVITFYLGVKFGD